MIRYVVIAILNILDLLITYIGIEKIDGIKETNPLAVHGKSLLRQVSLFSLSLTALNTPLFLGELLL